MEYNCDALKYEQRSVQLSVHAMHLGDETRMRSTNKSREFFSNIATERPSFRVWTFWFLPPLHSVRAHASII